MAKRLFITGIMTFTTLITACSGDNSHTVNTIQRKDKQLTCQEVLLEMNEANFYKRAALKNQGPKLKNVIMPFGYISTYMEAEEAITASDERVNYLDKIYEIMGCEEQNSKDQNIVAHSGTFGTVSHSDTAAASSGSSSSPSYMAEGYTPIRERYEQRAAQRGLYSYGQNEKW